MTPDNNGQAIIEDGSIVIRVPISYLPQIVEGAWATGNLGLRMKITDAEAFAKDLMHELNAEEEDGSTRVHRMFDGAINEAYEQGAQGIEEHEEQDE